MSGKSDKKSYRAVFEILLKMQNFESYKILINSSIFYVSFTIVKDADNVLMIFGFVVTVVMVISIFQTINNSKFQSMPSKW